MSTYRTIGLDTKPEMSLEQRVQALEDAFISRERVMSWFQSKLDSKNVKRLDTNETSIKSKNGETYINGPILEQRDASNVLRLKQGLDTASSAFLFALYNKLGNQTVGIDSNGNAVFTGAISASAITGGTITGGAISGGTIDGTVITGGTLQTAAAGNNRIVITGNKLETYNSSNALNGISWGVGTTTYGDVYFYDAGALTMEIANIGSGGGWEIKPRTTGVLRIGLAGKTVECCGTLDLSSATVTGLSTDSTGTHNHGIPDGTVLAKDGGGTVTFVESGAHAHTVS